MKKFSKTEKEFTGIVKFYRSLWRSNCTATNIGSPRVGIVRGQELGGGISSLQQVHSHPTRGKNGVAPMETLFNFRLVLFVISVPFLVVYYF